MSTFARLWTKQFWYQYPEDKPNINDYSLKIAKTYIFIVYHTREIV